ncbi:serine/threonine protein kinase [Streptomyces coffeae]|uniref:Serine/threonine protein kinase n=1 Tax=Streptomyces coffeae TaxID=621382 RepID=A0ABS1NPR1_9ACTN|nr:serine/threonine protein kinase [Streptomyces coffeae]MBL1101845.1 serine/threonine protein kinase [Streptomyces coffeae]
MEPLRQDDPVQLGVYRTVGRIDAADSEFLAPARRFIARTPGGDHTVLLTLPRSEFAPDSTCGRRFAAEAETARRLWSHSPALEQIVEISGGGDGQLPWYVSPYVPALPLSGALAAHGTGLDERTVRALGLALAEALAALHEQSFAYAGVTPGTVLMAWDRPRLIGFGCVRTLAPEGEERAAVPGLPPEVLPPEQRAGGRPRPPGDVFGLGAVLSYAATGCLQPDTSQLPEELRDLVGCCLAADPVDRPRAAVVRDELRAGFAGPVPPVPHPSVPVSAPATVLDGGAEALGPGWLPGRLIAALARQSAGALGALGPSGPAGPKGAVSAAGAAQAADAVSVRSEGGASWAPGTVPPAPSALPGPGAPALRLEASPGP